MPPPASICSRVSLELLGRTRDEQDRAAGVGDLQRRGLADARRGAGDHDDLAAHGRLERDVALQPPAEAHQLVRDLLLDDLGESTDEAGAAAGGADQSPIAEEIRVEVTLPVVPELARVGL